MTCVSRDLSWIIYKRDMSVGFSMSLCTCSFFFGGGTFVVASGFVFGLLFERFSFSIHVAGGNYLQDPLVVQYLFGPFPTDYFLFKPSFLECQCGVSSLFCRSRAEETCDVVVYICFVSNCLKIRWKASWAVVSI